MRKWGHRQAKVIQTITIELALNPGYLYLGVTIFKVLHFWELSLTVILGSRWEVPWLPQGHAALGADVELESRSPCGSSCHTHKGLHCVRTRRPCTWVSQLCGQLGSIPGWGGWAKSMTLNWSHSAGFLEEKGRGVTKLWTG